MSSQHKALFLDRDGVINVDHGYVYKPEEFEFIADVFDAVGRFAQAGFKIVVITNQSGIGRGYYSEQDFLTLSDWMCEAFKKHGITIDAVKYCPHHPEKALPEYLKQCQCRKPEPGMINDAIAELNINPKTSIFVGDKGSDMKAASSANIQHKFLVETGQTLSEQNKQLADATFDNLTSLANFWFASHD